MFEKVNPSHPDKVADRIAGALVDLAYKQQNNPKIAVEVLIGHGECNIIAETLAKLNDDGEVYNAVHRIAGDDVFVRYTEVPQDSHLATNQADGIRCGDNGIFRGIPSTNEQRRLSHLVKDIYKDYPYDGKFVICDAQKIIACQSNVNSDDLRCYIKGRGFEVDKINPLGDWTGGISVDTGATNRKLGSDMGDAVTGGGLHGKDLSKADVSVNIYAHIRAEQLGKPIELHCAIGDQYVDGLPYSAIVEIARDYIFNQCGGFEKFAEWGLI